MGRSGGSSGRSSGGRSSSSRSSGGFSGGGRSSRSYSSSSRSSGRSNYYIHTHNHYGPSYRWGYHTTGGSYSSNSLVTIIAFMVILICIIAIVGSASNNHSVVQSTKEREKITNTIKSSDWYQDDIGWISSSNSLKNGLEEFYNKTGVQPYIMFIPYSETYWNGNNINAQIADRYLDDFYSNKFKNDEGHFIFAYFECINDSKYEMDGEFRYLTGKTAETIMDNEAINIFWGYFEKNYYDTSLSTEEMISNTFSETAKNIMSKPTNGWDFLIGITIGLGVIIVCIIIYKLVKLKAKRDKEKEEYTKEILSKPLDTFGNDVSELEKKYKNDDEQIK